MISATPAFAMKASMLVRHNRPTKDLHVTTVCSAPPVKRVRLAFAAADRRPIAAAPAINATSASVTRRMIHANRRRPMRASAASTGCSAPRVKLAPPVLAAADQPPIAAAPAINVTPASATKPAMHANRNPLTKVSPATTDFSARQAKRVRSVAATEDRRPIAAARRTNATREFVTRPPMPANRSRYWIVRFAMMGSSA